MFAVMANAYSYPRHMHYRRDNGTDSGLTTLTVLTTEVQTVTSCAPTITDCPARDQTAIDELPETDKTTYVVTNTVVLTETVCPVTEAGSISKSVIQEAETGGITGKTLTAPLTADVPLSTGAYPPITDDGSSPETDGSSLTTIVSDYVTDKTVTLTLGTGTDASVTTTTVRSTIQTTVTVPCSEVDGKVTDNASPDEPTTTTTKTSTGTVTKTVEQADTTKTQTSGNGDDGYSTGNGNGDDEGDDGKSTGKDTGSNGGSGSDECPEAVTVTVTAPASTVYVTLGSDGSKTSGPDASVTGAGGKGDDGSSNGNGSNDGSDNGDDDEEDDDDEEEYCDETTTLEATVTVVPYPVNNTIPTSGYAAPTGFARRLR
jgi:hypothetical protein